MNKSTWNAGTEWKAADIAKLKHLAARNTPTRVIGLKVGRSPSAVQSKASEQRISLKPTNQSPRNPKR